MRSVWLFLVFVLMPSGGSGYPQKTLHDVIENSIAMRRQRRQAICGGEFVNNDGGHIQLATITDNGTKLYQPDTECTWDIKVTAGHHVILDSVYFDMELSDDCQWDYVEIVDGVHSHKFCSRNPLLYVSVSNKLTLNFKSDYSYEGKGFDFAVMSVPDFRLEDSDKGKKCNNSIIAESGDEGDIWNYAPEGKNCYYSILAPPGHTVQLKLKMLEFGASKCEEERVVIRDGVSTHGKTLWTICGGEVPEKEEKRANKVFIEYHNPLGNEGDRFHIKYSVVIDNFTPAPTTTPKPSPVGGNDSCSGIWSDINEGFTGHILYTAPTYEENRHCVLVVRTATHNHVVQAHFNRFEMEDSDNCEFDSLNIFTGERADSASLGGPYCANSLNGRTLLSSGNTMRLVFKTDQSLSFFGFQAKFTFVHMDNLEKDCGCSIREVCVVQGFEKMCIAGSQCSVARCENGATCVNNGSVDHCYCTAGYTGKLCNERTGSAGRLKFKKGVPQSRKITKGGQAECLCQVEKPASGERVVYSWYHEGKLIGDYHASSKFGDMGEGSLLINDFDEHFEGRYTCEARAGNSTAEHTFTLKMVEHCLLEMQGPSDVTEDAGKIVILSCSAVGAADIWWEKGDGKINTESTGGKFSKMENKYLRIASVSTQDSGEYTCVAKDTEGCESRRKGTLTILNRGKYEQYCGVSVYDQVRQSRAVGYISMGKDANQNENPWHVTLFAPNVGPFCGGSLISQKFVVTAAHCIREYKGTEMDFKNNVKIDFGSIKCTAPGDLTRGIKSITTHPQFNKTAFFDSDIALLELSEPVEYSAQVRPICVLDYSKIERLMVIPQNPNGRIAGCGMLGEGGKQPLDLQKRRVGDVCKGDSGGGFMMEITGMFQWVLAGIVSYGFQCDAPDHYTYFTNAGKFYNWINGIAKFTDEKVDLAFLGLE